VGALRCARDHLIRGGLETEEKIQEILPELDELIGGGLVTLERARVLLYRPADLPVTERSQHRIEGLEADGDGDPNSPQGTPERPD
jgi:hypothetical protein